MSAGTNVQDAQPAEPETALERSAPVLLWRRLNRGRPSTLKSEVPKPLIIRATMALEPDHVPKHTRLNRPPIPIIDP